jgi:hypothetical protein
MNHTAKDAASGVRGRENQIGGESKAGDEDGGSALPR